MASIPITCRRNALAQQSRAINNSAGNIFWNRTQYQTKIHLNSPTIYFVAPTKSLNSSSEHAVAGAKYTT
jgi:hypothetical protein